VVENVFRFTPKSLQFGGSEDARAPDAGALLAGPAFAVVECDGVVASIRPFQSDELLNALPSGQQVQPQRGRFDAWTVNDQLRTPSFLPETTGACRHGRTAGTPCLSCRVERYRNVLKATGMAASVRTSAHIDSNSQVGPQFVRSAPFATFDEPSQHVEPGRA
jgi:hypothetical protein